MRGVCGEGDGQVSAPQKLYHYEVILGGKLLQRNQECTLERGIGYAAGRYRFQYAEQVGGRWLLVFFGPSRRSKQRYRQVWHPSDAVRTIHRPTGPPEAFGG